MSSQYSNGSKLFLALETSIEDAIPGYPKYYKDLKIQ